MSCDCMYDSDFLFMTIEEIQLYNYSREECSNVLGRIAGLKFRLLILKARLARLENISFAARCSAQFPILFLQSVGLGYFLQLLYDSSEWD